MFNGEDRRIQVLDPTCVSCHFQSRTSLELQHFFGNGSLKPNVFLLFDRRRRSLTWMSSTSDIPVAIQCVQKNKQNQIPVTITKSVIPMKMRMATSTVKLELGQTFRFRIPHCFDIFMSVVFSLKTFIYCLYCLVETRSRDNKTCTLYTWSSANVSPAFFLFRMMTSLAPLNDPTTNGSTRTSFCFLNFVIR